jgi:hypothetical protein
MHKISIDRKNCLKRKKIVVLNTKKKIGTFEYMQKSRRLKTRTYYIRFVIYYLKSRLFIDLSSFIHETWFSFEI